MTYVRRKLIFDFDPMITLSDTGLDFLFSADNLAWCIGTMTTVMRRFRHGFSLFPSTLFSRRLECARIPWSGSESGSL